jgi:hypothetical protein
MILKDVILETINGKPYLLMNEIMDDYCAFSIGGEIYIRKYAETFDLNTDWVRGILVKPENIGLVHYGSADDTHIIGELNEQAILNIKANGGNCKIEIMKIHSLNKPDVSLENIKFEPIMVNDKVVIYLS